ncbi:MAG TPA: thioredoxin domain-containing protein [Thermoanaerobaculia bacterium]|nr:thioredoxin domain-containing protein [Thermoanaerobaculia bacterium]
MKTRIVGIAVVAGIAACIGTSFGATRQGAKAAAPAAGVEARLPGYLNNFLPWDPASKVTVEKTADRLPGFQGYKAKRTGKYPKLNMDVTVYVSDDGKWFFDGDPIANPNPKPVRSDADLAWIEARTSQLYRTRVKATLTPDRDAAGLKGVVLAIDSGFLPMHVPGYVAPDGTKYLNGSLYDFQMDPREERKKRIDLSQGRFEGKPNGSIIMVEYADMQCPYCRFRGLQMDQLLEANPNLSYKRFYKFFVLWFTHEWSTRAASAADCIFRFAKAPAMFAFKKQVYSQQSVMTVAGIDELAVTFAESAGIPRTDFLNCYLRDESLRNVFKDVDEGQRLGVKSTPTYFIDGTEINWIEDKVMEDFLRTKDPSLKGIEYTQPH